MHGEPSTYLPYVTQWDWQMLNLYDSTQCYSLGIGDYVSLLHLSLDYDLLQFRDSFIHCPAVPNTQQHSRNVG